MKLFFVVMSLLFVTQINAAQIELNVNDKSAVQSQARYSYNFGTVWVNSRAVANYTLRNTGTTPLTFNRAYIYGADFSANADFNFPLKRAASINASPLGLKFFRNKPGVFSAAFINSL